MKRHGILVVVPWLEGGGAQNALENILVRIPREDIRLLVLFSGSRNQERVQALVNESVYLDEPRSPLGLLKASFAARKYVRKSGAVYSLMRGSHVALGIIASRKLFDGNLIGSIHQVPSADASSVVSRLEDFLVKRFSKHASFLTCPSVSAIAELKSVNLVPPDKLVYEPNLLSIRTEVTQPADWQAGAPLKLLFAGRLTEQKGLHSLIGGLRDTAEAVHLTIAGDGPLRASLEEIAGTIPKRHKIDFVGYVPDISMLIVWCDFGVMPSEFELQPVFIWECWSMGRGLIVSDIPSFREMVRLGPLFIVSDFTSASISQFLSGDLRGRLNASYKSGQEVVASRDSSSNIVRFLVENK